MLKWLQKYYSKNTKIYFFTAWVLSGCFCYDYGLHVGFVNGVLSIFEMLKKDNSKCNDSLSDRARLSHFPSPASNNSKVIVLFHKTKTNKQRKKDSTWAGHVPQSIPQGVWLTCMRIWAWSLAVCNSIWWHTPWKDRSNIRNPRSSLNS